jgi:probable HAF family extracellular repeat protein
MDATYSPKTVQRLPLMLTCWLATLSTWAATPPRYHATELGSLGGSDPVGTVALGLNNKGHVVGSSSAPTMVHAFYWSDGELMDIGASAARRETVAFGINIHNEVVGQLRYGAKSHAFYWRYGSLRLLEPLKNYNRAQARQINASGTIAGQSWSSTIGAGTCQQQPTVWEPVAPNSVRHRPITIDLPGDDRCGIAWDINDYGVVVGVYIVGESSQAFIARDGIARSIPLSFASAINSRNEVLGETVDFQSIPVQIQSVIWNGGSTRSVGIVGYDMNNKGQVVGRLDRCCFEAALWTDGVAYNLKSLVQSVDLETSCLGELVLFDAFAINERGQIIVNGGCSTSDTEFNNIGLLLTPVP